MSRTSPTPIEGSPGDEEGIDLIDERSPLIDNQNVLADTDEEYDKSDDLNIIQTDRWTLAVRWTLVFMWGSFVDSIATRSLTKTFERSINDELDFRNATGMSPTMIILIGSACESGFKPLAGMLADQFGQRVVICCVALVLAVGYLASSIAWGSWVLLGSQAATGLGETVFDMFPTLALAELCSKRNLGICRAAVSSFGNLGEILGGLLALASWRGPLLVVGGALLPIPFVLVFFKDLGTAPGTGEGRLPTLKLRSVGWRFSSGTLILIAVASWLLCLNLSAAAHQDDVQARDVWAAVTSGVAKLSLVILVIIEAFVVQEPTLPSAPLLDQKLVAITLGIALPVLASVVVTYNLAEYIRLLKPDEYDSGSTERAFDLQPVGSATGAFLAAFVIRQGQHVRLMLTVAVAINAALYVCLASGKSGVEADFGFGTFLPLAQNVCMQVIDQCGVIAFLSAIRDGQNLRLYPLFSLAINLTRDFGVTTIMNVADLAAGCSRFDHKSEDERQCLRCEKQYIFVIAAVLATLAVISVGSMPEHVSDDNESHSGASSVASDSSAPVAISNDAPGEGRL